MNADVLEAHAVAGLGPGGRRAARGAVDRRARGTRRGSRGRGCPRTCRRSSPSAADIADCPCLKTSRYIVICAERDRAVDRRERDPQRTCRRTRPCRAVPSTKPQLPRRIVSARSSRVEPVEDRAGSAARKRGPSAEQLHLLRVVLAREHRLEVDLLARLRRAPAEQPERVARELGLGDERRAAPASEQHAERDRRERSEQRAELDERDRRSAPSSNVRETSDSGRTRPRAARASACRRARSPRTARARASAPSRGSSTLMRWPSCARSSDWQSEMPRCTPASAATRRPSRATRKSAAR